MVCSLSKKRKSTVVYFNLKHKKSLYTCMIYFKKGIVSFLKYAKPLQIVLSFHLGPGLESRPHLTLRIKENNLQIGLTQSQLSILLTPIPFGLLPLCQPSQMIVVGKTAKSRFQVVLTWDCYVFLAPWVK